MAEEVPDPDTPNPDMPGSDAGEWPAAQEIPVRSTRRASEWSFEWRGALTVLLLAVVIVIGWRWLGDSGSSPDESTDGHAAVTTTEPIAATTSVATTTSTTTTTVAITTTTTTVALAPKVNITGEMKPCRFGDNCLVASFTIEGFDQPSGRFTCIYPNSTREFSFQDDGKADACLTADAGDTITIEVDGVRSATISEDLLVVD